MTEIPSGMLRGCSSLTALTIPSSVTKIRNEAFMESGIKTLTCKATTPPVLGNDQGEIVNVFSGVITSIKVPSESVTDYKEAPGWSDKASIISAI